MPRFVLSAACLVVAAALAATPARAVVIDDFSVGATALEKTLGDEFAFTEATQTGLDLAHVAGGVRKWRFDVLAAFNVDLPATAGIRMTVSQDPAPHYAYDADDFVTAVNFTLRYDGGATSLADPGLNINLAAARHNAVVLHVASAEFQQGQGFLDVTSEGGSGVGAYSYTRLPSSTAPYLAFIPMFNAKLTLGKLRALTLGTGNGNLWGSFKLTGIATASTADADFDGDVDGGDFLAWQRNLGRQFPNTTPTQMLVAAGDANLNFIVDAADHAIWRAAQIPAAAPNSAATPEPNAAILATLTAIALAAPRRRRA